MNRSRTDPSKLDRVVAAARRAREQRERGYREQALRLFPWVCARCGREFERAGLHELTVHHRDHDHANNPPDGSNWELLCLYCHDDEHARGSARSAFDPHEHAQETFKPFEKLQALLDGKRQR